MISQSFGDTRIGSTPFMYTRCAIQSVFIDTVLLGLVFGFCEQYLPRLSSLPIFAIGNSDESDGVLEQCTLIPTGTFVDPVLNASLTL